MTEMTKKEVLGNVLKRALKKSASRDDMLEMVIDAAIEGHLVNCPDILVELYGLTEDYCEDFDDVLSLKEAKEMLGITELDLP